jgi:hypothetical protein
MKQRLSSVDPSSWYQFSSPPDSLKFPGNKRRDPSLEISVPAHGPLVSDHMNNGRAAQMGILGMMVHEQLDGKPFIFFDKFDIYAPLSGN